MTYSGNLKSLNASSSAPSGESDLARRAREIVDGSRGTVGHGPNEATMQAIENERRIQRMSGELPGQKGSRNLPTVRGDESTGDDSSDQLATAIRENQRKLRKTLENAGYSEEAISSALIELSKRTDETRADEGGYIVDRLRREDAARSRNAWQK
jgi:hypothetical protein